MLVSAVSASSLHRQNGTLAIYEGCRHRACSLKSSASNPSICPMRILGDKMTRTTLNDPSVERPYLKHLVIYRTRYSESQDSFSTDIGALHLTGYVYTSIINCLRTNYMFDTCYPRCYLWVKFPFIIDAKGIAYRNFASVQWLSKRLFVLACLRYSTY
jgi:hypothetical protein